MTGVYEQVFRGILFPAYEALRGRSTTAHLAQYERDQWLAPEQIEALQLRKLGQLLEHCARHVPYYRERFRALGLEPGDIRSLADYARIPPIEKDEIRANFDALKSETARDSLLYKSTGGSTGLPLRFGYTRESNERRTAVMWRGYRWAGARMGRRTLYLWGGALGKPPYWRRVKDNIYHAAFGRKMLDCFAMRDDNLHRYAETIASWRPEIVVAYVTPLELLARWLLENRRRVSPPSAILTGAEPLREHQRETIERAFGAPVFNTYGCREVMLIAAECDRHEGLHVNTDHLVVELGEVPVLHGGGETGDVILTDLHNYGMPLLRYRNGDVATAGSGRCTCGRGFPLLRSIEGRLLDLIRTPDGRALPGEFFPHLFKDIAAVRQFQVVQKRIDRLEIRIVPATPGTEPDLQFARREIRRALGDEVELQFDFVQSIPLTPSGKFRVTVSECA
jgi:phenylacetate-CoA ligase